MMFKRQLKKPEHFLLQEYKQQCPKAKADPSEKTTEALKWVFKEASRLQQALGTDYLELSRASTQQSTKIYFKF